MRLQVPVALLATLCVFAAVPAGSVAGPTAAVDSPSGQAVAADDGPAANESGGDRPARDADPPPDPEEDRLGWENGVWHNESVGVNASDGINRSESARLLDRTMARVELVRGTEFEEPVDLNFRTRSEVAELLASGDRAVPETAVNVQLEALGVVGEDRDAVDVLRAARRGSATAFVVRQPVPELDLDTGDVTVVVDEGETAYSEVVLAHELVHVVQVQELGVPSLSTGVSTDRVNANRAVTEGEASYVGYRYQQRCGDEWDCVTPRTPGPDRSDAVTALVYRSLVRYSHGGDLVAARHDDGGWDEVTDLYARPPASTEQVIHPEKYRTDDPQLVTVPDRSDEAWRPLTTRADTVGESGLFVLLWYPGFESRSDVVMDPSRFNDSLRSQIQVDFDHEATAGWDGDRLVPYVSDEAGENETGYVWRTVWDSERDATEFREAYLTVLEYRGAEPVGDDGETFRVPDDRSFGDAFSVVRNGSEVYVVNAPTVADLPAVHDGTGPETLPVTPTPTPTETPTPTPTATAGPTAAATATPTTDAGGTTDAGETTAPVATDGDGPGFGHLAVLLAVAVLLVATRRQA